MKTAINSFKASLPSETPLLAEANTPPALETAVIMSPASTANLPATALILPRLLSKSLAEIPNCLINAILPSTVLLKLSNVGAKALLAKASNAMDVSLALNPAWVKILETPTKSLDATPKPVDKLEILETRLFNPDIEVLVT